MEAVAKIFGDILEEIAGDFFNGHLEQTSEKIPRGILEEGPRRTSEKNCKGIYEGILEDIPLGGISKKTTIQKEFPNKLLTR